MATSGIYTFSRNRDQIIKAAARKVGAIESGEDVDSDTNADFAEALNAMVKHWQGTGIHIWTMGEGILFLQADQSRYTVGTGSTDHIAGDYLQFELTAAAASGATVISVADTNGLFGGEIIGVQVDDGSFHWTTIAGGGSLTTIVLTVGLSDSASDGAVVVTYISNIVRPLKIVSARRFNYTSEIETPIDIEDRESYFDLPLKSGSGTPNLLFYDRRGGANSTGYLYFWQAETSPADAIKFTWARPIQDFNAAADDPDFPQEWTQCLIFNLALVVAPEYDVPPIKFSMIKGFADTYLAQMQWNEMELEAISFVPARR